MAADTVLAALAKLESGKTVAIRNDGLDEIRRLFGSKRNGSRVEELRDDAYHRSFETLYQIIRTDRSAHLKALRSGSRTSTTQTRLESDAAALRLIVEAGYHRIKFKTAVSVLDHIVEILPTSDEELCEPLRTDYLKALRTLLEYQPLVEHLKPKQWQTYLDFALAVLSISVGDEESSESFASSRDASISRSANPLSIRVSQSHGSRKSHAPSHAAIDDLLAILRSLAATTNAPVTTRAAEILDAVLDCLRSAARSQELALETFNNVALILLGHNVRLLRDKFTLLLPVARRLWSTRSPAVREQLLATFSLCQGIIAAKPHSPIELDLETKSLLLHSLQNEYASRGLRDLLLSEDIELHFTSANSTDTGHDLVPSMSSSRAISQWILLRTIAQLHHSLHTNSESVSSTVDTVERASKRRKTVTPLGELLQQAVQASGSSQAAAVQILLFLTDSWNLKDLEDIIELHLSPLSEILINEDSPATFWTLLVFSRLASSALGAKESLRPVWTRVLDAAGRAASTTTLARAACLVLASIARNPKFKDLCTLASLQRTLFAAGKSGPANLSDAAVWMFASSLQSSTIERDDVFESFSMKVLAWIGMHWVLPANTDRAHNAHTAFHARPEILCILLAALKGVELHLQYTSRYSELSDLAQLEARSQEAQKLAYLLSGLPNPSSFGHVGEISVQPVHLNGKTRGRLDFAVAGMLQAKLRDFADAWATLSAAARNTAVTIDVIAVATSLCVVSYASTSRSTEDSAPSSATQEPSNEMWQCLQSFIAEKGPESQQRISTVAAIVSRLSDPDDTEDYFLAKQLLSCSQSVCKIVKDFSAMSDVDENDDIDMLDSIDTGTSQNSQASRSGMLSNLTRYELPENGTPLQSTASCILDLTLLAEQGRCEGHLSVQSTAAVLDEILTLDAATLIGARQSIYRFLALQPSFTREQALQLLRVLGTVCLADSKFERCEAALSLCARVMAYLARYWTPSEDDDLDNRAYEMYEWFISFGLGKAVLSPTTVSYLAHLLDAVAGNSPHYGEEDLPSTRTSLFKILHDTSCLVKLKITSDLDRIFGRFVLREHGAIFDDIVDSLPSDPDDLEGLGTRFYILAQLGSRWHSVLRHATYSLFETAAHATSLIDLQSSCIVRMCDALALNTPKDLFHMFSPQILYTWLGIGTLNQIAYRAFSYDSIRDLVTANEPEVVAQIALRGTQQHVNDLTAILGKTWKTLLQHNFARAEAYCLASQMTLPEKEQLSSHPEAAIRKELGTVQYGQSLQEELPLVVATLFETLQDDVGVERAFDKAGLDAVKAAFKAMSLVQTSTYPQLSTQQPSFRSKFIIEEIRWLCSRLKLSDNEVWSSALLIRLFRSLFRTVHPTLGPLHASGVLRKLRIVVALGGINAMHGYPLEMLLHNLRPYLTVFQCSGDAIAIYRYLLENGREHLQTRLSFLSGVSISIFASLTAFVSSSQDSTTQESHFLSTMTKAQEFRSWLATYLGGLSPAPGDSAKYELFKAIINHAQVMNGDGTSSVGSHQGLVLLALLEDQVSEAPLLQSIDFDLCISILCKNFSPATEAGDDILASGVDAVRLIPVLERVLRSPTINPKFRVWVGQCIGRGVSLQGPFVRPTGTMNANPSRPSDHALTETASYQKIINHWEQLLWKRDGKVAASAEQCLQTVASQIDPSLAIALLGSGGNFPLLNEMRFNVMSCPVLRSPSEAESRKISLEHWEHEQHADWAGDLLIAVCAGAQQDPILRTLQQFVYREPEASHALLPFAIHVLLATELDGSRRARQDISTVFSDVFTSPGDHPIQNVRLALETTVYLRRCVMANETSIAQRTTWLEVDYVEAARAAIHCQQWHTALLLIELRQAQHHLSNTRSSRRSTQSTEHQVPECIMDIYQHVDDPDFFYAGHEDVDVDSIVQRLNHESAGYKTLSFQSALYDSAARSQSQSEEFMRYTLDTAKALSSANLKGISQAVKDLVGNGPATTASEPGDTAFTLLDWPMVDEEPPGVSVVALQHLKTLSSAANKDIILSSLDQGLATIGAKFGTSQRLQQDRPTLLISLAILAEAKDALRTSGRADFEAFLGNLSEIESWGSKENFELVSRFLNAREYIVSSISRSPQLRAGINLSAPQALLAEACVVRQSLHLAQEHESHQFSLSRATYFSSLSRIADGLGVNIKTASQYDLARTLWAQDERGAAVKILQGLRSSPDGAAQDIPVAMSEILAELGQRVTQARLEPPNEVIENYLVPAYKDLGSDSSSAKAGQIFHIFAAFCDGQLQDQDSRDEYMRLCQIKENKEAELRELQRLMTEGNGKNRDQYSSAYHKASTWYKLDNEEWERVRKNRESLVLRCLEHYLLSLKACDTYANDTLRVLTIWLEEYDNPKATDTVGRHLKNVPSWKFAGLVNQLLSRLVDTEDAFQQCLMDLMFRICSDHPFHSLYQVFCASKSKANKADEVGSLRHKAAAKLADTVLHKSRSRDVWPTIHNLSMYFVKVAQAKLSDKQVRTGSKLLLQDIPSGTELIRTVEHASKKIPPPTMQIAVRPSRDYKSVPVMATFDPRVNIAGGISAPKIATITASDGSRHKLLMKGGNDDLRQDSIMEQVFEQVSNLLKDHRATRERKLGIRTYKVVPLLTNAGIIEFVQNTLPLNEYLMPAHVKYFPKGYSHKRGRAEIDAASKKPLQQRLQAYRTVTQNFPPVMRFFFMENFLDPDEWFYKRLNYSRSTAAISMLGHVLGLGDRHGHNILLDTNTGEVVHIDLGVAFEAGRVLPIPEVVPFRLTRDLVDGMGISGVEGVFRRCCNFTLEALRLEQESIMTILDVLRYDPLYSWSVSPLRVARMQENANRAAAAEQETNTTHGTNLVAAAAAGVARRRDIDESAEAGRALAVVAKKLGKGLSVEATVNELIRQATDERNLAVLFCGWAAYA